MSDTVYQVVTDRIIGLLEKGVCPWRRPWASTLAQNAVSRKEYRGLNSMLLNSLAFDSPYWLTFKQAKDMGGSVKKGEKGTPIIFWKWLEKDEVQDDGTVSGRRIPLLRYYTVFNASQCEGLKAVPEAAPHATIDPASVPESYPTPRPTLAHGGSKAYYRPSDDHVQMPPAEAFENIAAYWSTLYHELTHSTGHASRLNRKAEGEARAFGDANYSREELVAEMGAAFLCAETGVQCPLEPSAAYLQSWLAALRAPKNVRLIVEAAGKAQKAADFILGRKWEEPRA